jgi:glycogen debranching enzyme
LETFANNAAEPAFTIDVGGSSARPNCTLKQGDSFAVLDNYGDIGTGSAATGFFHCDTRYLSRLQLYVNRMEPLLLGSSVSDDNSTLNVDLTNPDIFLEDELVLTKDRLHIVRTTFLWDGRLHQRLGLQNHSENPIDLSLSILFASDFADIFEVRGLHREVRGTTTQSIEGENSVALSYRGLDDRIRRTEIEFEPTPSRLTDRSASFRIALAPKQRTSIFVVVSCDRPSTKPLEFFRTLWFSRHALKRSASRAAAVETSNDLFNEVVCRSVADLYMLVTDTAEGPYPYAGIPWYSTTFGRDGLITALEMLWLDASVARGVLHRLAALQATTVDPPSDAEPGKILHEIRGGELAALKEVPFGLYYGSVDSTPLFILLAGLYAERTGDDETFAKLWPAIERGLNWIDTYGDRDQDGFVEYYRASEEGLANQAWKDSSDAVFHADGRLASGPLALAEVQGYVYAAKQLAARAARRLGLSDIAAKLQNEAKTLSERFESAFWCPEINSYALALDGEKNPCRVKTSNAGQLLFTGIVGEDRGSLVARGLLGPEFFTGWGVRTVSSKEQRYNPMSYHNGSIWPHDNALIALGLARYGHKELIDPIFQGLFEAACYMELRRLPELFCGFQRRRGRGPTLYPVACSPQAWASGSTLLMLQAVLGLGFDPAGNVVRFHAPRLPPFLDRVMLRNLQLGESSLDVVAYREGRKVRVETLRALGTATILVEDA